MANLPTSNFTNLNLNPSHLPGLIPALPRAPGPAIMARRILWSYVLPAILPGYLVFSTHLVFRSFFYESTFIKGSSMSPTLSPDYATTKARDRVLWHKWDPTRDLRRGDVILFDTPHNREECAVKRVIALPGDTVLLDPRRRPPEVLNGRRNEAAWKWDVWEGKVKVPEGHVWVEGDNWRKTRDSNWYGCISKTLIQGRAVRMLWPRDKFWTTPWERYKIRTKVIEAREMEVVDYDEVGWWQNR